MQARIMPSLSGFDNLINTTTSAEKIGYALIGEIFARLDTRTNQRLLPAIDEHLGRNRMREEERHALGIAISAGIEDCQQVANLAGGNRNIAGKQIEPGTERPRH